MAAKFILEESKEGCYQFTFHALDNQVLLTSPFFADKGTALSRIDTVRSLASHARNIDVCSTADGKFYIVLKDNKSKLLGQSGMFADRQSLQRGMEAIKKCSGRTGLVDRTPLSGIGLRSKKLQSSGIAQKRTANPSRIILTKNGKGYYSFTFQAPDGQVLLTSPFFTDKKYTLGRIALARSLAARNQNFETRTAETGQLYIVVKNAKHEEAARSPLFSHIRSMREWTASIKDYTADAVLRDLTHGR